MAKQAAGDNSPVVVIGLGRFGAAVAQSLVHMGHELLVIDADSDIVHRWADEFTHVVQADATDEDALKQLGVDGFSRAVVGIGSDIEASVLTVLALAELGVNEIWAKAVTKKHGQILHRVGADHVVYPESAMGERVAHMVTGTMSDFIEFDDGFAISRTRAPEESIDRTLGESQLRRKYAITVVGVKRQGKDFTYARPETEIQRHDELIISGATSAVEKFCALTQTTRRAHR